MGHPGQTEGAHESTLATEQPIVFQPKRRAAGTWDVMGRKWVQAFYFSSGLDLASLPSKSQDLVMDLWVWQSRIKSIDDEGN